MKTPFKLFVMTILVITFLLGSVAVAAAADDNSANSGTNVSSQEKKEEKKDEWKFRWDDGFKLDSADKSFGLKFGGRLQMDWMWGSGDDDYTAAFGDVVSGNEMRRAFLYVAGTVYKAVEFKVEYDFVGGTAKFKDMFIGILNLPFGKLRIGHFKEPFNMEELTSDLNLTFIERSLPNMFAPSRNTGFAILGNTKDQKMTWGLGAFTDANDYGDAKTYDDTWNFSGRFTILPWTEDKDLLHLGIAYHYQGVPEGGTLSYSNRPEVHLTNKVINTGSIPADSASLLGAEAAVVFGQFSAQAEYIYNMISSSDYGDPTLQSGYVYATYFLTPGDQRNYKKSEGVFDRVKPKHPYLGTEGMGAWEVAVRYSWADLTDAMVLGGELKDISVALNWYLNNVTRMMFDYNYADRDGIGNANFFQMRFQVDF
jgi:phosphate-selective porin OprO/OprP